MTLLEALQEFEAGREDARRELARRFAAMDSRDVARLDRVQALLEGTLADLDASTGGAA